MRTHLLLIIFIFFLGSIGANAFGTDGYELKKWRIKNQNEKFEAKYLYTKTDIVFFEDRDGEMFLIPISNLSKGDRFYIECQEEEEAFFAGGTNHFAKIWLGLAVLLVGLITYRYMIHK